MRVMTSEMSDLIDWFLFIFLANGKKDYVLTWGPLIHRECDALAKGQNKLIRARKAIDLIGPPLCKAGERGSVGIFMLLQRGLLCPATSLKSNLSREQTRSEVTFYYVRRSI